MQKNNRALKISTFLLPYISAISYPMFLYSWWVSLKKKELFGRDTLFGYWIGGVLGLTLLSLFFSVDKIQSFTGGLLLILLFSFILLSGKYLLRDKEEIVRIYLYSLTLINLFGIVQWLFHLSFTYSNGPIYIQIMGGDRVSSLTAHPNAFGILAASAFLLSSGLLAKSAEMRNKIKYMGLGGVAFAGILLTQSRGALIAALVGFIIIFLLSRKKLIFLMLLIGVATSLLLPFTFERFKDRAMVGDSIRVSLWKSSLEMISAKPIMGFGPATFGKVYPAYREKSLPPEVENFSHPHDTFLKVATEWGVPFAILFFGGIIFLSIRALWKSLDTINATLFSCVAAYLIFGLFDEPLFVGGQLYPGFWLLLGLLLNDRAKIDPGPSTIE